KSEDVEATEVGEKEERDGLAWRRYLLSRKGAAEQIPAIGMRGKDFDGTVVVWIHPAGKASLFENGKLVPAAQEIINRKAGILAVDGCWTGEHQGVVVQVKLDDTKLKAHKVSSNEVRQIVETFLPADRNVAALRYILPKEASAKVMEDLGKLAVRSADGAV